MTSATAPSSSYTPASASSAPSAPGRITRIVSLDIVRGVVMILMVIDHVRVYAGVPPGGPTPGVFFTRWVTHFCAPAFIFLAGTAAFLHGHKLGSKGELSRFLVTRGLWLVLLELTLLRFGWTFNFDYANFTFAGVIWAIGWSMVILAALVHLPLVAVGAIGLLLIAGHNAVAPLVPATDADGGAASWLWAILYGHGSVELWSGGPRLIVLYVLLPWIGVMAAGYAFGAVMRLPDERRRRLCLTIGIGAIALFLVLRGLNLYGDPRPWTEMRQMPALLAFLNTAKYPASLLFLLMTLGPTILAIALLDRARGPVARAIAVFGRVPFFFYVLHIPLIHLVAVLISLARTPESTSWLFANHPMLPPPVPDGYRYSLGLLYLVTAAVTVALYFPCRWFADLKARRRDWWLSYL